MIVSEKEKKNDIDISIIVPAYNESAHIMNLLDSINDYIADFSFESIVIDNGSEDDTYSIAKTHADHVYQIPRGVVSKARNFGASISSGKVLVFLDADVRLTRLWADELRKQYNNIASNDVLAGARYQVREHPSYIEWSWFRPLSEKVTGYINGGNIIISRKTFDKAGGFNEQLETGEDVEFCDRAREMGIKISINPNFKVYHDGYPSSFGQFVKREIWHGKGDYTNLKMFIRSRVAVVSLIFALLHYCVLFCLLSGRFTESTIALFLILVITILMSIKIFRDSGPLYIIINLPLCYLYLVSRHISLFSRIHPALKNRGGTIDR